MVNWSGGSATPLNPQIFKNATKMKSTNCLIACRRFRLFWCSIFHLEPFTPFACLGTGGRPSAWSEVETQRFYAVLRQYGPNFSLLETFFPGRSRQELKSKYNRIDRRLFPRWALLLGGTLT